MTHLIHEMTLFLDMLYVYVSSLTMQISVVIGYVFYLLQIF